MSSLPHCTKHYSECDTCLNREYDPFRCLRCKAGDHYEDENNLQDSITLQQLIKEIEDNEC